MPLDEEASDTSFTINFLGNVHRVEKFQSLFTREGITEDLDDDVIQFFSELQDNLIEEMISTAGTLAEHRKSEDIDVEDILCYLDMKWNIDPLALGQNYYKVVEVTDEVDISVPQNQLQVQKMEKCQRKIKKKPLTRSKDKKISSRELKLKSKNSTLTQIKNRKSKSKVIRKKPSVCIKPSSKIAASSKKKKQKFENELKIVKQSTKIPQVKKTYGKKSEIEVSDSVIPVEIPEAQN